MTEQLLNRWRVVSEIDMGHWNKAYLCEDDKGNPRVLWWPDTKKHEVHYGYKPFSEGKSGGEASTEIEKKCEEVKERFKTKLEKLVGLSNPHVAEIFGLEYDEENKRHIAVSEYCYGEPAFLASRGLTIGQKIGLLVRVLRGLDFIHSNGMLHLNLKSDNVYVEIVKMAVKIINWGFALSMTDKTEIKGKIIGTPAGMAHEIILGPVEKVDERADLFSWAVLAYQILTGVFPFPDRQTAKGDSEKLKSIVAKEREPSPLNNYGGGIPSRLEEIVLGMLKREPDERLFKNATSLLDNIKTEWPGAYADGPVDSGTIIRTKLTT